MFATGAAVTNLKVSILSVGEITYLTHWHIKQRGLFRAVTENVNGFAKSMKSRPAAAGPLGK